MRESSAPSAPPHTAVLLSAHGTVEREEDLPAFLANIRRGRPSPPQLIEEVTRRFRAIGGSPLLRISRAQADALSARLGLPVQLGMRLWRPTIDEALEAMSAMGVTQLVSLPLAPQSVHVYHAAVAAAVEWRRAKGLASPTVVEVDPWGDEPALLEAFCDSIARGLTKFAPEDRDSVAIILSAHSLPRAVIARGDPYEQQFRAMADLVVARRHDQGHHKYVVAFQSQGADGGDWLGPDLPTTFASLVAQGHTRALIASIGFLSDHVETLYDLDIEAKGLGQAAGLAQVERAPSLDAHPLLIDAMATAVTRALARANAEGCLVSRVRA